MATQWRGVVWRGIQQAAAGRRADSAAFNSVRSLIADLTLDRVDMLELEGVVSSAEGMSLYCANDFQAAGPHLERAVESVFCRAALISPLLLLSLAACLRGLPRAQVMPPAGEERAR